MKQIVRDLQNNAIERLHLWLKDTIMRFDAVDLDERDAIATILTILVDEAAYGLKKIGMAESDFLILMQHHFRNCRVKVEKITCEDGK